MGRQEHGFREYVRQLFKRLMGTEVSLDSISERPSSRNKYLSVSVSVYLLSEEQRRAIYLQLHKEKRVLYYL
jgi:putative lipoic acid-binding regulatory protein